MKYGLKLSKIDTMQLVKSCFYNAINNDHLPLARLQYDICKQLYRKLKSAS